MRGFSAFESFRTYHRQPFRLDEHLDRLYRSAALMELTIPWPREQVAGVITQVIERNAYTHAAIRILVTGGISEDTILPGAQSTLAVLITPLGGTK